MPRKTMRRHATSVTCAASRATTAKGHAIIRAIRACQDGIRQAVRTRITVLNRCCLVKLFCASGEKPPRSRGGEVRRARASTYRAARWWREARWRCSRRNWRREMKRDPWRDSSSAGLVAEETGKITALAAVYSAPAKMRRRVTTRDQYVLSVIRRAKPAAGTRRAAGGVVEQRAR